MKENRPEEKRRTRVKNTASAVPKAEGAGETLLKCANLINSDFFLVNSNNVAFEELAKKIDSRIVLVPTAIFRILLLIKIFN